jgi:hypothetical protein
MALADGRRAEVPPCDRERGLSSSPLAQAAARSSACTGVLRKPKACGGQGRVAQEAWRVVSLCRSGG